MKDKINVAELLKDCPKGMALDCTMLDNVVFEKIDTGSPFHPIIIRRTDTNKTIHLTKYGQYSIDEDYKCVIFPKGKTTWEGFQRPFKDGDIVYTCSDDAKSEPYEYIFIFESITENTHINSYLHLKGDDLRTNKVWLTNCDDKYLRFASEEEKEKLFQAIKANGYKWNKENKTLEKLVEPKFKVGDRIWMKENHNYIYTITGIRKKENKYECGVTFVLRFSEQDDWELVPNKFDITTLKPFESRVLVRNSNGGFWQPTFWGIYEAEKANEHHYRNYLTTKGFFRHCIPYNDDTKHLLGTTDDCEDYYKTWK